jgi:hypothetical protein
MTNKVTLNDLVQSDFEDVDYVLVGDSSRNEIRKIPVEDLTRLEEVEAAAQRAEDSLYIIDSKISEFELLRPPISVLSSGVEVGQGIKSVDFTGSSILVSKGDDDDYTVSFSSGDSGRVFTAEMNGTSSHYIAYHNLGRLVVTARVTTPEGDVAEVGVSNKDENGELSLDVSRVFSSVPMIGTLTLI